MAAGEVAVTVVVSVATAASVAAKAGKLKQAVKNIVVFKIIFMFF